MRRGACRGGRHRGGRREAKWNGETLPEIRPMPCEIGKMSRERREMNSQIGDRRSQKRPTKSQTGEMNLQTRRTKSQTRQMNSQNRRMNSRTREMKPRSREMNPRTRQMKARVSGKDHRCTGMGREEGGRSGRISRRDTRTHGSWREGGRLEGCHVTAWGGARSPRSLCPKEPSTPGQGGPEAGRAWCRLFKPEGVCGVRSPRPPLVGLAPAQAVTSRTFGPESRTHPKTAPSSLALLIPPKTARNHCGNGK